MGSQTVQLCATCRVGLTQSVYPTIYISLSPSNTWYTRSDGLATLAWWLGHNLLDPQRSDFQGPDSQLSNQVPGLILVIEASEKSEESTPFGEQWCPKKALYAVRCQQPSNIYQSEIPKNDPNISITITFLPWFDPRNLRHQSKQRSQRNPRRPRATNDGKHLKQQAISEPCVPMFEQVAGCRSYATGELFEVCRLIRVGIGRLSRDLAFERSR